PLRGTVLARPSPSCAHDDDRLRLPPASPAGNSKAGKNESTGRRLSQLCPPYATPSSNSSLDYRRSDARIVENGFATSGGVSKSAKVVLGRGLINAQPQAYGRKLDECEVVGCELVVAGCHTPTVLDLIEEPLDQVSRPVEIRAEAKSLCPISFRRDIRPSAMLANKRSDPVGVISSVSQQHCSRL